MNGHREAAIPIAWMGDAYYANMDSRWRQPFDQLAFFIGQGGFSDLSALPEGAYPPQCWRMALDAGSLSSHQKVLCEATATLTLVSGMALSGSSDGVATASGTAQLIVSMSGSASGTATASGAVNAALFGAGTSDGVATTSGAITAIGWLSGSADGVATGSLGSYAVGHMAGAIYVNQSQADVNQIVAGVWDAATNDYDASGSMGEAMGAAGTAGDPWTADLTGYGAGSAGEAIRKTLKTGQFLALK